MSKEYRRLTALLESSGPVGATRVLGLSAGVRDARSVEEAALRCVGHVRPYQLTDPRRATRLLNVIARAVTLLTERRGMPAPC